MKDSISKWLNWREVSEKKRMRINYFRLSFNRLRIRLRKWRINLRSLKEMSKYEL